MQSSSNKTVSSEDGSKYLSLGHIPFWPVNPMATSIKNIYPNKFHNSLPNLPLLLLPYALVWRYVYLHACTIHHHSFPAGASMYKHTHRVSIWLLCNRKLKCTHHAIVFFTSFKPLHEWLVHQQSSSCNCWRKTSQVYISETFTARVSHYFSTTNAKDFTRNTGTDVKNRNLPWLLGLNKMSQS